MAEDWLGGDHNALWAGDLGSRSCPEMNVDTFFYGLARDFLALSLVFGKPWAEFAAGARCEYKGRFSASTSPPILATMRLFTLFSVVGLVNQAFSTPFSCDKDISEMTLTESDAAVKSYFSKLESATKKTLLHDTTGPEAGADVR